MPKDVYKFVCDVKHPEYGLDQKKDLVTVDSDGKVHIYFNAGDKSGWPKENAKNAVEKPFYLTNRVSFADATEADLAGKHTVVNGWFDLNYDGVADPTFFIWDVDDPNTLLMAGQVTPEVYSQFIPDYENGNDINGDGVFQDNVFSHTDEDIELSIGQKIAQYLTFLLLWPTGRKTVE